MQTDDITDVVASGFIIFLGEVGLKVLGHSKGTDLLLAEDRLHLLVGLEVLLVLGIL